jgi:hypothetical protein
MDCVIQDYIRTVRERQQILGVEKTKALIGRFQEVDDVQKNGGAIDLGKLWGQVRALVGDNELQSLASAARGLARQKNADAVQLLDSGPPGIAAFKAAIQARREALGDVKITQLLQHLDLFSKDETKPNTQFKWGQFLAHFRALAGPGQLLPIRDLALENAQQVGAFPVEQPPAPVQVAQRQQPVPARALPAQPVPATQPIYEQLEALRAQQELLSRQVSAILLRVDSVAKRPFDSCEEPDAKRHRSQPDECAVCLDEEPAVVLVPCGHLCLCRECTEVLRERKCPLCRAQVDLFQPIKR